MARSESRRSAQEVAGALQVTGTSTSVNARAGKS